MAGDKHRPYIQSETLTAFVQDAYGMKITEITELESWRDRNFRILSTEGEYFVLKIVNPRESQDIAKVRTQIDVLSMLRENGFVCPQHIPDKAGNLFRTLSFPIGGPEGEEEECLARLLSYIPGKTLKSLPELRCPRLYKQLGTLLALFHQALKDVPRDNLEVDPENEWVAENATCLRDYISCLKDSNLNESIEEVIKRVEMGLRQFGSSMERGVTHGDFHDQNLIVNTQIIDLDSADVNVVKNMYAIIYFNEICYSYRAFEVGRLIADLMAECQGSEEEVFQIGCHVISGYLSVRPLSDANLQMMHDAMYISLAQFIVLSEYEFRQQPDNLYCLEGVKGARERFALVKSLPQGKLEQIWIEGLKEYGFQRQWCTTPS